MNICPHCCDTTTEHTCMGVILGTPEQGYAGDCLPAQTDPTATLAKPRHLILCPPLPESLAFCREPFRRLRSQSQGVQQQLS